MAAILKRNERLANSTEILRPIACVPKCIKVNSGVKSHTSIPYKEIVLNLIQYQRIASYDRSFNKRNNDLFRK